MSDLQGQRIPGEEDSGRRRRWVWIILGLILLLLLALLIPFACQNLTGGGEQGDGGQGAQGGAEQSPASDGDGQGARGDAGGDAGGDANGTQGDAGAGEGTDAGGGGNGGDGAEEQAGSGDQQEVAAARLSVRDQGGDGASVTVPTATVEGTRGWLAVRANDGGEPGEVLGHAPLRAGTNNDVEVELDRPVDSSQRLYATVHAERPADGEFTYPDGDPTLERDGRILAEPISYTVDESPDEAPGDTASDGIRDDELPDSGGLSPTALLAAGALLLAAGAWGLRRAFR